MIIQEYLENEFLNKYYSFFNNYDVDKLKEINSIKPEEIRFATGCYEDIIKMECILELYQQEKKGLNPELISKRQEIKNLGGIIRKNFIVNAQLADLFKKQEEKYEIRKNERWGRMIEDRKKRQASYEENQGGKD